MKDENQATNEHHQWYSMDQSMEHSFENNAFPRKKSCFVENISTLELPPHVIANRAGRCVYNSSGKFLFPWKLNRLLNDAEREGNEDIVSWLPHGRAFKIHNPKEFERKLMKKYFRQSQFKSFTRQVSTTVPSFLLPNGDPF